jgi:hypothetical protein
MASRETWKTSLGTNMLTEFRQWPSVDSTEEGQSRIVCPGVDREGFQTHLRVAGIPNTRERVERLPTKHCCVFDMMTFPHGLQRAWFQSEQQCRTSWYLEHGQQGPHGELATSKFPPFQPLAFSLS